MIKEAIYKLQHAFNLNVFKKHAKRLFKPKESKTVDWETIGNEIYDDIDLTNHMTNRSKNAMMYAIAMQMEIAELIAALGFKWWSIDAKNWVNVKETDEYKHLVEEYVDIGHFYMSLGHALGLTAEQIQEAYDNKLSINYLRQENGY